VILLTRRYGFSAAHVLARKEWAPDRNRRIYGKCANPAGHGHNYELFVTVTGEPHPETGMLAPAGELDRIVQERVLSRLDGKLLNDDLPEFEKEVPTAENIARFSWRALEGRTGRARLWRIRLGETSKNTVECGEENG
jgi:6-pyruvoyltetrahydropterin/6-carboxytetrahydropterin synthase